MNSTGHSRKHQRTSADPQHSGVARNPSLSETSTPSSIVTEETTFPVHLVVVSATCHYFRWAVNGSFKEASEKKVTFPDISSSTMRCILKFCYTGEFLATKKNFCKLVLAASKLQNIEFLNLCQQGASKYIDEGNFLKVLALGKSCELKQLSEVAAGYCKSNLEKAVNEPDWVKIDYEDLLKILNLCEWYDVTNNPNGVEFEQSIYKAVILWIEADKCRLRHVDKLFKYIQFETIGRCNLAIEIARLLNKNANVPEEDKDNNVANEDKDDNATHEDKDDNAPDEDKDNNLENF